MQIGRRIYYDNTTGNVLIDTGERQGSVRPTTSEQDVATYKELSERVVGTYAYIELPYGQYAQDFAECNGYRVNPETKAIEFSYPDGTDEPSEPVHPEPLSVQVEALKHENVILTDYVLDMDYRLIMIELMGGM